jgi:hypothetical protein
MTKSRMTKGGRLCPGEDALQATRAPFQKINFRHKGKLLSISRQMLRCESKLSNGLVVRHSDTRRSLERTRGTRATSGQSIQHKSLLLEEGRRLRAVSIRSSSVGVWQPVTTSSLPTTSPSFNWRQSDYGCALMSPRPKSSAQSGRARPRNLHR